MTKLKCLILFLLFVIRKVDNANIDLTIPKDFLFGVASSAYQYEGAWNVDGKGEGAWDYLTHHYPWVVNSGANGDITTNFYYKYKDDIQIIDYLGFNAFRLSLSWSRILPTGFSDEINQKGIRYYNKLLDELEKRGITPILSIHHWDHPQPLESAFGGWLSEKMAYVYADYARLIFKEFGNRIKYITTFNEPDEFCRQFYGYKELVPKGPSNTSYDGWAKYQCVHNILKGHALVYRIYNKEYRAKQNGAIGIAASCHDYLDKNNNRTHTKLSQVAVDFQCGLIFNPIFSKDGDYPANVKERVALRSKAQGLSESRLPVFSKEWIDLIKGSADFLGLNHYTTNLVEQLPFDQILQWDTDSGLTFQADPSWPAPGFSWIKTVPEGFGNVLRSIRDKFDNPPVYVLENGVDGVGLQDDSRIDYLYRYIREMLIAIKRDGCNVKAYTMWTLLDSYEWTGGYVPKFGIVDVNFYDFNKRRTLKKSAYWLKRVLKAGKLLAPPSLH